MAPIPPFDCPICRRPVLGLLGQDAYLPDYLIGSSTGPLAGLDVRGWVHAACLRETGLLNDVTECISSALLSGGAVALFRDAEIGLFWHERTSEFTVLSSGTEARIPSDACARIARNSELTYPVTEDFSLRFPEGARVVAQIAEQLRHGGFCSLNQIIAFFGIEDRLIMPSALRRAKITPLEDEPDVTFEEINGGLLEATLQYEIPIDPSLEPYICDRSSS